MGVIWSICWGYSKDMLRYFWGGPGEYLEVYFGFGGAKNLSMIRYFIIKLVFVVNPFQGLNRAQVYQTTSQLGGTRVDERTPHGPLYDRTATSAASGESFLRHSACSGQSRGPLRDIHKEI